MTTKNEIKLPPLPVAVPWHKGYDRESLESYACAAVEADRQGQGEPEIRRLLCVAYAGAAAYMDDGEAQDNRTAPFIDFLRDSPAEIQRKMTERARKAAVEADQQGDDDIRALWRKAGGQFHGPNVETGAMPEAQLLPFLRRLMQKTADAVTVPSDDEIEACGSGEPMSLAVALDFADNPRPYGSLAAPADTNGELYKALRVLAAEYRALLSRYGSTQPVASALQYAQHLAQSIFQRHYAGDEAYASGRVKWSAQDDLSGVLTQIDNMTAELVRQPVASAERAQVYSDMSRESLERHAARLAQALTDNKAMAFWARYAIGPKSAPSCICCGHVPDEVAIRHAEIPSIVVCRRCHDAATAPVAQEPVLCIRKNASGQIYLTDANGEPFDVSKYVGVTFYATSVAAQTQPSGNAGELSDEREAFVAWLSDEFPRAWPAWMAERAWDNNHVAALAWRAAQPSAQDREDALRWRYIRQFLVLDDVGDDEYCLGLVVLDERLVESVTPHVGKLLSDGKRNPTVDNAIDAARAAKEQA